MRLARTSIVVAASIGAASQIINVPLAAQTAVPVRPVVTEKIGPPPGITDPMIGTDTNGMLLIDWPLVEHLATSPGDTRRTSIASLMLAIRDGQWRPMPK